jgi:hypothetical protein
VTHEDFSRQEGVKPSSDRSFGLIVATFFLIITLWPLIHAEPAPPGPAPESMKNQF